MPQFANFVESAQRTRANLEETHERALALLDDPNLLRYADVRELVRSVDGQIGALQHALITLRDTLTAAYAAHGGSEDPPRAEPSEATDGPSDQG